MYILKANDKMQTQFAYCTDLSGLKKRTKCVYVCVCVRVCNARARARVCVCSAFVDFIFRSGLPPIMRSIISYTYVRLSSSFAQCRTVD